jgi:nucleotide-binding universal stress UspA family protein
MEADPSDAREAAMTRTEQHREIVVGVDGSADSDRAVRWALRAAAGTHRPVRFVHSEPRLLVDPLPPVVEERLARAGRVLDAALAVAASDFPEVTATAETRKGLGLAPAEAVADAGAEAALLVVGARGHGGVAGLIGSVSQHAVRRAAGPVAIVRAPADARATRIVVGLDDSDLSMQALALAFELADAFAAPLTAIHAWHYTSLVGSVSGMPLPGPLVGGQAAEQGGLDRTLEPWRDKYPEVEVEAEVVPGPAARALRDASEHAAMVVVGSRGRGAVAGLVLGSVSQSLLHRAHCPVIVAR